MDFGYYGCSVTNRMGMDEQSILLEREGEQFYYLKINDFLPVFG